MTTGNAEYISALRSQQQEKIEDLKQATNFYSTKALLERFDSNFEKTGKEKEKEKEKEKTARRKGRPDQQPPQDQDTKGLEINAQPENNAIAAPDFEFAPNLPSLQPSPDPHLQQQHPHAHPHAHSDLLPQPLPLPLQPMQLGPVYNANYQPTWYDKILDIIVGEDEYSPKSRYALICENCRRHNGLAQPGELPMHVVYICPQCGFRNGQEKKKKRATTDDKSKEKGPEKEKHIFKQLETDSESDLDRDDGEQPETAPPPPSKRASKPANRASRAKRLSRVDNTLVNLDTSSAQVSNESSGEVEKVEIGAGKEKEVTEEADKEEEKPRSGLHQRKKSRKGT